MKRKQHPSRHLEPDGGAAKPFLKFSHESGVEMSANIEQGIRDLPVWKALVARVGLQEARKILRRGMLTNSITDGNPEN